MAMDPITMVHLQLGISMNNVDIIPAIIMIYPLVQWNNTLKKNLSCLTMPTAQDCGWCHASMSGAYISWGHLCANMCNNRWVGLKEQFPETMLDWTRIKDTIHSMTGPIYLRLPPIFLCNHAAIYLSSSHNMWHCGISYVPVRMEIGLELSK